MNLDFDFDNVSTTEFGVGRQGGSERSFCCVSVDGAVQDVLREMALATWDQMRDIVNPPQYEPSEKYSSVQYVTMPLNETLNEELNTLHHSSNLPMDPAALDTAPQMFCYFARFSDTKGRKLTAIRQATHFKGVLKKRLVRLVTDALTIIDDQVFKLDADFDLLTDATTTHILRPNGFERFGRLKEVVLAAASDNARAVREHLPYIDFEGIEAYANRHPRAARCLASIRSQGTMRCIDRHALMASCAKMKIPVHERDGMLSVPDAYVLAFLEVLDRRRYQCELVTDAPECFRAPSRQRLNISNGKNA